MKIFFLNLLINKIIKCNYPHSNFVNNYFIKLY